VSVTTKVQNAGTTDVYGNPSYDETVTEYLGWVEQTASVENEVNRETRLSTWLVLLPPEAVVDGTSLLSWDENGTTLTGRVLGRPKLPVTSRGVHHVEVTVETLDG